MKRKKREKNKLEECNRLFKTSPKFWKDEYSYAFIYDLTKCLVKSHVLLFSHIQQDPLT